MYQLTFHGGKQQRYFPDRRALLECILRIAGQSREPIFEIWGESAPAKLRGGSSGGKSYVLLEVLDMSQDEILSKVARELQDLRATGPVVDA